MNIVWLQLATHWLRVLLLLLPFCYAMNIQPFTVMHTVHLAVSLGLFAYYVALWKIGIHLLF